LGRAGRSAQQRYERLSARRREGRNQRLIINLVVAAILGIAFWQFAAAQGYTFGPWVAGMILLIGLAKAVAEPSHVRAWSIGAHGERITEQALESLPDGHQVLHDRRIPGTRANIDHIVVGPGGVFVVESKRMRGKLRLRGDTVFVAGRRTAMVDEVIREAEAVRQALSVGGLGGIPVQPLLYMQEVELPWFLGKPRGIPILTGRRLVRHITGSPAVLSGDDVTRIAAALSESLRPMVAYSGVPVAAAVAPTPRAPSPPIRSEPVLAACPRCGKDMVLRRNRNGQAFLGCSQFPHCRGTRPWRETPD
jgi:hypothetical protein